MGAPLKRPRGRSTKKPAARGTERIVGRNAVLEVLRAGRRRVWRLEIVEGAKEVGALQAIVQLASARGIPVERVRRQDLESQGPKAHGVAADTDPYAYVTLEDILLESERRGEPPFVLLLDALQDPQNLGTLLRTAEGVGVHGVVLPYSRAVGVTPAVVRASSGASEYLAIAAANLAVSMARLREVGVRIVGLEAGPDAVPLHAVELGGPLGLVVGNEGEGLRRLTREACDVLVELPMRGRLTSFNAAVAGSIALYQAASAREGAARRGEGTRRIDAPSES